MLRAKELDFLKAMLEESTITKASEKANISRKTAYSYLQKEEFKREQLCSMRNCSRRDQREGERYNRNSCFFRFLQYH